MSAQAPTAPDRIRLAPVVMLPTMARYRTSADEGDRVSEADLWGRVAAAFIDSVVADADRRASEEPDEPLADVFELDDFRRAGDSSFAEPA